ncbi:hypothetical protein SAMN05192583_1418 [Sphingomonas gellani]|uniref:DUF5678 domain-containing protein n=1 Tax=Sphingomonas gellani TaxID=1166340 RepID=A0A1H8C402_9SPHN|nr:hypothetical protein [Sphingomonas gellani]SEM89008.1 hypothetical protein SAMN05192583_1418 [Sphingomonas gellani]
MDALQEEIDRNFDSFQRVVHQFLPARKGQWALLRHGDVTSFYPTAGEAEGAGMDAYKDDIFSIQEVTEEVVDLGFFSHVVA